ncbi:hypothetical protein VKT23_004877 [Stygiomarasmius scandens]|uniref:Integrase catalytic domain-containing protein n=1 Tax=Marasmiellus scandens TaxID=2682957 RepID=A0ABR1JRM2_9AGAR
MANPSPENQPFYMDHGQLVQAFRQHYAQFNTLVNNAMMEFWTSAFHLRRLGEDLEEFESIVNEHGSVLEEQELQTLEMNLIQMKHDVSVRLDQVRESEHAGRPIVVWEERTGQRGRPRTVIHPWFLAFAYYNRRTTHLGQYLGVSSRTVRERLLELGIAAPGDRPAFARENVDIDDDSEAEEGGENDDPHNNLLNPDQEIPDSLPEDVQEEAQNLRRRNRSYLSEISDLELDSLILRLRTHYRRGGVVMMSGMLRRLGHVVQDNRIQESLRRIDPYHRAFSRIRIRRRGYNVPGPNSLWHHDGQHALIRWKILIHAFIDGYSRVITGMRASNNNWADTVLALFLHAIAAFGRPDRLRGDFGGENVDVAAYMEHHNGRNRGSYIWGQSIHNTRIERLWFDVTAQVSSKWKDRFIDLELNHGMNINNPDHIWLLQFLFLSDINEDLRGFAEGWNQHPLRSRGRRQPRQSPLSMFFFDMFVHGVRGTEVDLDEAEIEAFGIDWDSYNEENLLQSHDNNHPDLGSQADWQADYDYSSSQRPREDRLNYVIVDPPREVLTEQQKDFVQQKVAPFRQALVDLLSDPMAIAAGSLSPLDELTTRTDGIIQSIWNQGLAAARYCRADLF